jgi:hypothetical protein
MTGCAPTCQWGQLRSPVDARLQHEAEMAKRATLLERAGLCPKCGHGCVAHREGGSCPYDVPSVDPVKAAKYAGEPGPSPPCWADV